MKLISQADFARRINKSRQYVSQLVRDGKLTTENGKIVEDSALKEYNTLRNGVLESEEIKNPSAKHQETEKVAATGHQLQKAKAITQSYVAKLKKREYEILEKEYIHIDQVVNEIETASAIVRSKLLALPNKLATELENLTHSEIETKLENEINKCFIDITDLAEEYKEMQANVKKKETGS